MAQHFVPKGRYLEALPLGGVPHLLDLHEKVEALLWAGHAVAAHLYLPFLRSIPAADPDHESHLDRGDESLYRLIFQLDPVSDSEICFFVRFDFPLEMDSWNVVCRVGILILSDCNCANVISLGHGDEEEIWIDSVHEEDALHHHCLPLLYPRLH